MQKTEKKAERFPSHSPFSAYSSLNSSYLVDGPSWTHNSKASPGMLGGSPCMQEALGNCLGSSEPEI